MKNSHSTYNIFKIISFISLGLGFGLYLFSFVINFAFLPLSSVSSVYSNNSFCLFLVFLIFSAFMILFSFKKNIMNKMWTGGNITAFVFLIFLSIWSIIGFSISYINFWLSYIIYGALFFEFILLFVFFLNFSIKIKKPIALIIISFIFGINYIIVALVFVFWTPVPMFICFLSLFSLCLFAIILKVFKSICKLDEKNLFLLKATNIMTIIYYVFIGVIVLMILIFWILVYDWDYSWACWLGIFSVFAVAIFMFSIFIISLLRVNNFLVNNKSDSNIVISNIAIQKNKKTHLLHNYDSIDVIKLKIEKLNKLKKNKMITEKEFIDIKRKIVADHI